MHYKVYIESIDFVAQLRIHYNMFKAKMQNILLQPMKNAYVNYLVTVKWFGKSIPLSIPRTCLRWFIPTKSIGSQRKSPVKIHKFLILFLWVCRWMTLEFICDDYPLISRYMFSVSSDILEYALSKWVILICSSMCVDWLVGFRHKGIRVNQKRWIAIELLAFVLWQSKTIKRLTIKWLFFFC